MDMNQKLLAAAKSYEKSSGKTLSTISNLVAGYGTFFDRLEAGKGVTTRTYEKARIWFQERGIDLDKIDLTKTERQ